MRFREAGMLLSAFSPMVLLVAVLRHDRLGVAWSVALVVVAVASIGWLHLVVRATQQVQTHRLAIKYAKRADDRLIAFASSYVVPIVLTLLGGKDLVSVAAFVFLALLLAFIYVRGRLYFLNPLFPLLGFRLFEVTGQDNKVRMVLARDAELQESGEALVHFLGVRDICIQARGTDGH